MQNDQVQQNNIQQIVNSFYDNKQTRLLWLLAVIKRDKGFDCDEIAAVAEIVSQKLGFHLEQINKADNFIVENNSRYYLNCKLSLEQDAFFHEEFVHYSLQHLDTKFTLNALYQSALIHQLLDDICFQADDLGNIAMLLLRSGNLEKAKQVFYEARTLHCKVEDKPGEARDLANLSIICNQLGQRDDAVKLLNEALEIFEKLADSKNIEVTKNNLKLLGH